MSLYMPNDAVALGLDPECRNDVGGATADAGAGGAGAPPVDAPVIDPTGAAGTDASAATDVADDVDDDGADDAELNDAPFRDDPRFKRLQNRVRSLNRRVAKSRDLVDAARALGITHADLRDVVDHARRYRDALPVLQSQEFAEVLARLAGGRGERGTPAERGRREAALPDFNEDDFPFDKNDPAGRWMLDRERRHHNEKNELISLVRALSNDVAQLHQGVSGEQRSREVGSWRSAIDAAAGKLPEKVNGVPLRVLFKDACVGAYHMMQAPGRRRFTAEQVISHYLKEFNASPTQTAAAKAAAAQRIAENNKTRPGGAAFAGGTPTKAGDRSQERIGDVSRRLLGKRYIGSGLR